MRPMSFEDALAYAKARRVVLPDEFYDELQGLARAMAFTVSKLAQHDQIKAVLDSLNDAIEKGTPFQQWKKTAPVDLPAHRLENIFRTNIQSAWNKGRCALQRKTTATHPWYMYDAVNDDRTRPAHAAMDGFVARHDDPRWAYWTPPNGYQCRCRRIALTDTRAQEFLAKDIKRMADPAFAAARSAAMPDDGWAYSVCDAPEAGLEQAARERGLTIEPPEEAPWFTSVGDAKALEELGRQRFDELLERLTPDDSSLVPIMSEREKPLAKMLERVEASDSDFAWADTARVFSYMFREYLGTKRKLGGKINVAGAGTGKAAEDLKRVSKLYPSDWIEKANEHALEPAWSETRGYFTTRGKKHPDAWYLQTNGGGTTVHEYGHHLQFSLPEMQRAFREHHWARTFGEKQGPLYEDMLTEVGKTDKYTEPYIGREYNNLKGFANGEPLEVLAMAFEALLSADRRYQLGRMLKSDRRLLQLAMGVLMHFKP